MLSQEDYKERRNCSEDNRKRALRNRDSRGPFKVKIGDKLIIARKVRKNNENEWKEQKNIISQTH